MRENGRSLIEFSWLSTCIYYKNVTLLLITRLLFPILFFAPKKSVVHSRHKLSAFVSQGFEMLQILSPSFFSNQCETNMSLSHCLLIQKKKDNATAKVLMKSKPLMWSVKLWMIWRIPPFKWRWYNESTLNRKQLKGQIGLINLKVIPLPQMVCNIQIIIIKNLEQICSLFGLS